MYDVIINPGKPYVEHADTVPDVINVLKKVEERYNDDYLVGVFVYEGKKDITDDMFVAKELFGMTPEEFIEEYDFLCIYNQMMLDIMEDYGLEPWVDEYGAYGWSYGGGFIWADGSGEFPWYEDEKDLRERIEEFISDVDELNGEYSVRGSYPLCSPWVDFYENTGDVEKQIYNNTTFNDISPIAICNHADCMYEGKALESAKRILSKIFPFDDL